MVVLFNMAPRQGILMSQTRPSMLKLPNPLLIPTSTGPASDTLKIESPLHCPDLIASGTDKLSIKHLAPRGILARSFKLFKIF